MNNYAVRNCCTFLTAATNYKLFCVQGSRFIGLKQLAILSFQPSINYMEHTHKVVWNKWSLLHIYNYSCEINKPHRCFSSFYAYAVVGRYLIRLCQFRNYNYSKYYSVYRITKGVQIEKENRCAIKLFVFVPVVTRSSLPGVNVDFFNCRPVVGWCKILHLLCW